MSQSWFFKPQTPSDKGREPMQAQFFAAEAPVEAVVREAIQNSLDAKPQGALGPVRVRIFVSSEGMGLLENEVAPFFNGAWPHFRAKGSGLRECPVAGTPCSFVAFEDFNTSGLTGDIQQWSPSESENAFYCFLRAEGRSNKGGSNLGRHGIGKFTFPQSSRVRSFFAYTVRHDDKKKYLVGQAVLRLHSVGTKPFTPDGWYGPTAKDAATGGELPLPIDDAGVMDQFRRTFNLKRDSEPGLSVVIPYCPDEFTLPKFIGAVGEQFYFPILNGDLVVELDGEGDEDQPLELNRETLIDHLKKFGAKDEVLRRVRLVAWGINLDPSEFTWLDKEFAYKTSGGPEWDPALIPEHIAKSLRTKMTSTSGKVAVRVPIFVREHGSPGRESYFDVYLERDLTEKTGQPVFIREGLIISRVRGSAARGFRSAVVATHRPIATLLGDAENPAHTEWLPRSDSYAGRYAHGNKYIPFVRESVSQILQIVSEESDKEDRQLLADFFPEPPKTDEAEEITQEEPEDATEEGTEVPPVDIEIEPGEPKPFTLHRIDGGFSITAGPGELKPGSSIKVQMAYDVRRGSALKRYSEADFDIRTESVKVKAVEADTESLSSNCLRIKPLSHDFRVTVTGFDTNRDLYLRPVKENQSDAEA